MNISGIRPNEGFYTYNIETARQQRQQLLEAEETEKVGASLSTAGVTEEQEPESIQATEGGDTATAEGRQQSFNAYDYASGYDSKAEYSLTGADSDLYNLDMEKAISDMRKDQLLQQYQFFVGVGSQKLGLGAQGGALVRPKENFEL